MSNFSYVYLANMKQNDSDDASTQQAKVVIKQIFKNFRVDNIATLIQNEISSLRALSGSPYFVDIYQVFESNKYVCIVIGYIEGGDLS